LPVFVLIEQRNQHSFHKNEYFKRTFKNFDSISFCNDLYCCLESYFIIPKNESELDIMFTNFLNDIRNTIDRYTPLQKRSKRKVKLMSKPWLTKVILISIENKQKLPKTFYRNRNNFEKTRYKRYANLLTRIKSYLNRNTTNSYLMKVVAIPQKLGVLSMNC